MLRGFFSYFSLRVFLLGLKNCHIGLLAFIFPPLLAHCLCLPFLDCVCLFSPLCWLTINSGCPMCAHLHCWRAYTVYHSCILTFLCCMLLMYKDGKCVLKNFENLRSYWLQCAAFFRCALQSDISLLIVLMLFFMSWKRIFARNDALYKSLNNYNSQDSLCSSYIVIISLVLTYKGLLKAHKDLVH